MPHTVVCKALHRLRMAGCALIALAVLVSSAAPAPAQSALTGLLIYSVNSASAPDYTLRASVLLSDGSAPADLTKESFQITAGDGSVIPVNDVQPLNGGIAVMIVADLGGLDQRSPRGVNYQEEVEAVARRFVSTLQQNSLNQEDAVGLVVTTGTGENRYSVELPPTTDLGLVSNSLETIKSAQVEPATALFDGLNKALDIFASQPDLEQKRKVILLFSDGADKKFSDDAILGNIPVRAREGKVTIFTLQARKRTDLEAKNLTVLAAQSGGQYALTDGTPDQVNPNIEAVFNLINSQRTQYNLTFQSVRPQGDYSARLTVNTPAGAMTQEFRFISNLLPPAVRLTAPPSGNAYEQIGSAAINPITLKAEVSFPNDKQRAVTVEFRVDGKRVAETSTAPYTTIWQAPAVEMADADQSITHTLSAVVKDTWLPSTSSESNFVELYIRIGVRPTPTPAPASVVIQKTTEENWPLVIALGLVVLGLLALALVLILSNKRTRAQMQQLQSSIRQNNSIGNVVRSVTRRLVIGRQAFAELEVVQGAMRGQMLPIETDTCWIGRDSAVCQIVLQDDAISSQHCKIVRDANGQLALIDERSTNGTMVNQSVVAKGVSVPLVPGSTIQIGRTIMVVRMGRETRRLEQPTQRISS